MALRKPGHSKPVISNFNANAEYNPKINNYLGKIDYPTNFELKPISLEMIDQHVYREFNKRFRVRDKYMPLISSDAEIPSLHNQNFEQYDPDKQFLNGPYFVYTRSSTKPMFRTAQNTKKVIYAIPKMKAQGIVIEEWIAFPPIVHELVYEFKFITVFRESANEMQQHFAEYFKNKRNVIVVAGERFSVGAEDSSQFGTLEIINRDDDEQMHYYVFTFNMKLYGWTRSDDVQKRERPNTVTLDINIKETTSDGKCNIGTQITTVDRYELQIPNSPTHPL